MTKHYSRTTDNHHDRFNTAAMLTTTDRAVVAHAQERTVVLVDETVEDSHILLESLGHGTEVIRVGAAGIEALAAQLKHAGRADALHIVTHGEPGALHLGGARIDEASLEGDSTFAAALKDVMASGARLALWACSVGADAVGKTFTETLGALTGATVFASDRPVGADALGGTWNLGTASPFTGAAMERYPHTLPASNEDFDGITAQIVSNTDHFNNDSTTDWDFTQGTQAQIAIAGNANGGTFTNGLSNDGSGDRIIFLNYNGLTSNHTVFGFEQSDGDHFRLESFELGNNLAGYSVDVTITVLMDDGEVGSATFNLNTSSSSNGITYTYGGDSSSGSARPYGTVTFDATQYRNVDEVSLVYTGAATPIMDNIVVSAPVPNEVPVVNTIPTDITVTEDVVSNFSLTTLDLTDDNDDELTVTLSIDTGTFVSVADGAASGVTETLVSSTEITLVGNADELEAYLSDASVIQYQGANNDNGDDAGQLTVTIDDQFDTVGATANIDITPVNDLPTFGGTLSANIGEDSDTIGGTATITDVDTGEDSFDANTDTGTYGTLTIAANGDWVYDLDESNTDVQALGAGDTLGDTLTVSSVDGTTQDITITIVGAEEVNAPYDIELATGGVTENQSGVFVGTLSATDPQGDAVSYSVNDSRFRVEGDKLYLAVGTYLDYEDASSLTIRVSATDSDGYVGSAFVEIPVLDVASETGRTVAGSSGGDSLGGSSGNDIMVGGQGNDHISGGDGNDFIVGDGASDGSTQQTLNVNGDPNETGSDTIYGGAGDDTILGGGWDDDLVTDNGAYDDGEEVETDGNNNFIWAGAGDDVAAGSGGSDVIGGSSGADTLKGLGGDDTLYGNDDDDVVMGGAGDDVLYGGAGDDMVDGGTGDDRLWAGAGDDILTGGDGTDTFAFGAAAGNDTVTDFSIDDDILHLAARGFADVAAVEAAASNTTVDGESGLLIDLGSGESVFLIGLSVTDLAAMQITV